MGGCGGFVAGFDDKTTQTKTISIRGNGSWVGWEKEGYLETYSVMISSSTFTVSGRGWSSSPKAMRKASTEERSKLRSSGALTVRGLGGIGMVNCA